MQSHRDRPKNVGKASFTCGLSCEGSALFYPFGSGSDPSSQSQEDLAVPANDRLNKSLV
jgi:hypothetical protein